MCLLIEMRMRLWLVQEDLTRGVADKNGKC